MARPTLPSVAGNDVWGATVNAAINDVSDRVDTKKDGAYTPPIADLPSGSVIYTSGTTRPTSRTDIMVIFTGADPTTNAFAQDWWTG